MRKLNYQTCVLLLAVLACAAFPGCQTRTTAPSGAAVTAATDTNAGRLVVRRAANLGENLLLSIDGANQPPVRKGDTYTGSLSAGPHVVSAILEPNEMHQAPTVKNLTVEPGQTYTFTAMWEGDTMVLR